MPYDDICEKLGVPVVNSMIEYNIIHLRLTSSLSDDVPIHNSPIITPESPASLVAMRKLLSGYSKYKFGGEIILWCDSRCREENHGTESVI